MSDEQVEIDADEEVRKACERIGVDYDDLSDSEKKQIEKKVTRLMGKAGLN